MKKKLNIKTILVIVATIIILGISLFPYFYMIIQSLAPWDQTDKVFIPSGITLKSYEYLLGGSGGASAGMWVKALLNSFIVSAPTAIVSVLVGLLVGYSVSKMKNFRGEKLVMNSLLFQMFFPVIILLVPRYMISKPLTNTYLGMILPLSVSIWGIFMYINYLKSLPDAVFEAARIDGASELKILWHIAFPVTKSVTTIVFLSTFMTRWSELMWDMLISPKINMQTLNVLISTQFKPMGNLPGPMYAASVILTLPIVIMFLCFSKYFKEGINFMLK
ncbi:MULTISPECIES: carbohydrate ABC transporter permease [Clostridium]|jgi:multiple sugar transport system permease protein|uniref:carbohydrate ABC transporter permease n=1 Tax=Clostridium TaxID=1485 RepID=UPI000DD046C9|nr:MULTISPECIES: carbohydrate ABC transporter permease [Clostridium]MBS5305991.1 carbohydrate ABC transporter permease [Clostridium sp.]MBU6134221.1 carbohydrate ABC transporter permease [Clostridium tertium]MDB1969797.1 carbohydrate ABC transporter permease [Clostridium tertium]MDU1278050.1 carbohydrate ABC transporter permease [Clostridium sp.]MDU3526295.1 carbohydrate ABC transporter permease [Clostridium sp.]